MEGRLRPRRQPSSVTEGTGLVLLMQSKQVDTSGDFWDEGYAPGGKSPFGHRSKFVFVAIQDEQEDFRGNFWHEDHARGEKSSFGHRSYSACASLGKVSGKSPGGTWNDYACGRNLRSVTEATLLVL